MNEGFGCSRPTKQAETEHIRISQAWVCQAKKVT